MSARYKDLRDFIADLEARGDLKRISQEIDPNLEMTEIADRTLRARGPALLFENPKGHRIPVLANLFGTEERVALGMGADKVSALREIGELLAYLRQPDPPKGLKDAWEKARCCARSWIWGRRWCAMRTAAPTCVRATT